MMLRDLPLDAIFLQHEADIKAAVQYTGENPEDITGAVCYIKDGEYTKLWLSQSSAPYLLSSEYYEVKLGESK